MADLPDVNDWGEVNDVTSEITAERPNVNNYLKIGNDNKVTSSTAGIGGLVYTTGFIDCDQTLNVAGNVYLIRIPISSNLTVTGFEAYFNTFTASGIYGLGCYDYDGTDWTLVAQSQNTVNAQGEFLCTGGPEEFTSGLGKFMAFHQPSDSTLNASLRVRGIQSGTFSCFRTNATYNTAQGMPASILAADVSIQTQAPFGVIRY